jgi:hypothetical protein
MATSHQSLKGKQRQNLLHAYRARGHSVNNLWLVYSHKTNRDWVLPSDRHLVHWLYYLERATDVFTFDLMSEPATIHDAHPDIKIDAVVRRADGTVEWHSVANSSRREAVSDGVPLTTAETTCLHRKFSDQDLLPHVRTTVRWIKALGYAATIRERELMAARLALLAYVHKKKSGTLGDLLHDLPYHDPAELQGIFVRLALEGILEIDLSLTSFGPWTRWTTVRHGISHV